jgi:hypothetical protein
VTESGVAIEEDGVFTCHPDPERSEGEGPPALSIAHPAIPLPDGIRIERLIITHGIAHHEFEDRAWSDETKRFHLSLVKGSIRALIDRAEDVPRIADALHRAEQHERDAPPRLRLAPNVSAALLPALVGLAPPNVELLQTAGGIDGKGNAIVEARDHWPNWYRPSYRIRPIRMPLNLCLRCDVTGIEPDRPVAVALLAPLDGLTMRVLIDDRRRAYPATVRVTRIDAVARETVWYPYGGGSFGAEMML